jgi:hypothetical protein
MKNLLGIVVLSLLLSGNAYANILDLKCIWNSGYSLPEEDLSSQKGSVEFFKIDLRKKEVLDSPSGFYSNKDLSSDWTNWVYIEENEISFGSNKGQGAWITEYTINRQTGVLESRTLFNEELLKGLVVHKYLCSKYDSKNKF